MLKIIMPEGTESAYRIAAQIFQDLYRSVTGICLPIEKANAAEPQDDMVVIGDTDVNALSRYAYLEGWLPESGVAPGTDGYAMTSVERNGCSLLFLRGGRGRSTLYAVYDFFERRAGCRYFWDGDVILHRTELSIGDLDVLEKPDFSLRGIRYFAHRGLHRFQAEHWGLEDWKKEIDWLVKRRLNMFMLRIGIDDLFQKAFPDTVEYPSAQGELPEVGEGYDARTLFWSLQYRGWLRRQVLNYAFERDLLHPEDCGTMTHWYSRTPVSFLEKTNPQFIPQISNVYNQPTGRVWDIREDENMDRYFQLTRTHVEQYGQPRLFHTIGLAERMCSADRDVNMRFKKMAYERILSRVEREWPGAPVLIASWDFVMNWYPDEVRELLKTLDPKRHIAFDYTADSCDAENNYKTWGFYQKYPWIFGIFHAFEPCSDIRGNYQELSWRLDEARNDFMCQGLVFWPELSHSDTLMLEFFSRSAWSKVDDDTFLENFCRSRYGQTMDLYPAWIALWPMLPLRVWTLNREEAIEDIHQEYFFDVLGCERLRRWTPQVLANLEKEAKQLPRLLAQTAKVLDALAQAEFDRTAFHRRDSVDIARTALGRTANAMLLWIICHAARGEWNEELSESYQQLLNFLCDVLDTHPDYSQSRSLELLRAECPVNDRFEISFKKNLANSYSRGYASEFMRWLCIPENQLFFAWLKKSASAGCPANDAELMAAGKTAFQNYLKKPLREMEPVFQPLHRETLKKAAHCLSALADSME
ncbi:MULTISPECIES: alpha-N-acetylglucosaminidase TIM-barrel domain-containing protein [Oscillospiraceae]